MRLWKTLWPKNKHDPRCSFCNKSHRQVVRLVTGPSANICNECTAICSALVAEDEKAHLAVALAGASAVPCLLCQRTKAPADLLHVPNCGAVCYVCIAAIKVAAGRKWDFREETDT